MAVSPVDKGDSFIESGMTLITEVSSEKYLNRLRKPKYQIPADRLSKSCGGSDGFDDYVERFEE